MKPKPKTEKQKKKLTPNIDLMVVYVPLKEFLAAGASAAQSFASVMLPSKWYGKREEN